MKVPEFSPAPTSIPIPQIAFTAAYPDGATLPDWALPEFQVRLDAHTRASNNKHRFKRDATIGDKFQRQNAAKLRNVDRMRFHHAIPMVKPLQPELTPLPLTAETAGTQGSATPTPDSPSPEKEENSKINQLLQDGWGGPADRNPSFQITTEPTTSSVPAISGAIPTGEPGENQKMEEATSQHRYTEWNPPLPPQLRSG